MPAKKLHYWEIWYPKASATGLLYCRCRVEPVDRVIAHAVPDVMTVEVFDGDRKVIAGGKDLERTLVSPMCELRIEDGRIVRRDFWPTNADAGATVLLPGGEAGILTGWWNADDQKEWRWQIEFYNSIR